MGGWFKISLVLGVFFILTGCKKADYDTRVTIRPRVIRVQGSPDGGEPAYLTRIYAWYIDKNERVDTWRVSSWADAGQGIATNVKTGDRRYFEFLEEQPPIEEIGEDEKKSYLDFVFSRQWVFLLAVNDLDKFYAYRVLEVPTPMPSMLVTLRFVMYREEASFKESEWTVVNAAKEGQNNDTEEEQNEG